MLARIFILALFFIHLNCEVAKKSNDMPDKAERGSMLGVDTVHNAKIDKDTAHNVKIDKDKVHNVKIDKDTVINRNWKLERKGRGKNGKQVTAPHHGAAKKVENTEKEREPDWSYSSIPAEVSAHVELFKRNMTECLKEVQADDKRTVKRLSPKQESPVHGECLIACVLKRNGVIADGKVHKENLLSLVSKFYSKEAKLMKKLEKNVDRCIELSGSGRHDDCALAARLNGCTNDLMAGNKHKIVVNY